MSTSLFMVAKFDQRQASPIKMSGVLVAASMGKSPLIALQRSIKWEIVFFSSESAPTIIYFLYTFFRELLLQHREGRDGISCWQSLKTFPKRSFVLFRVPQNYHHQNPIFRTLARFIIKQKQIENNNLRRKFSCDCVFLHGEFRS